MLSPIQRAILIRTAREAVHCRLERKRLVLPSVMDESLTVLSGAFVSLHAGGDLRGCIGVIEAAQPLLEAVASCAVSAAVADPRFAPVTIEELPGIRFEISVLSSPRRIGAPAELEIGRHGIIVTGVGRKALLLPQIATHQGWTAEEFLTAACRKAALPDAAWRTDTILLEVFTAEVFAEEG